ncbi:MAG: Stf0 family sulfotransferase [Myxococcota bacterium]|nr:Stf0 family sulfotransferase [Myxococcota bacterium]
MKQNYLVCSMPRTGSNLLCFTLAKQGLGVPMEYLNLVEHIPMLKFMIRLGGTTQALYGEKEELLRFYLPQIQKHRTTPNGVFGMKIFSNHLWYDNDLNGILQYLDNPKIIFVYRNDLIDMAISYYFAHRTGLWHDQGSRKQKDPEYDFDSILAFLKDARQRASKWRQVFKTASINQKMICKVNYSELASNFEHTIQRINRFLGHPNLDVPPAPIQKQKHPLKQIYKERFTRELKAYRP